MSNTLTTSADLYMAQNVKYHKELERPIIFIGNPRSGTSIISEIVMRHKDLGFPSQHQVRYAPKTNINYIRRIFDNRFWRFFGQKNQLNKVSKINRLVFIPWEGYRMWNLITPENIDFGRGFLLNSKADEESSKSIRLFFKKMVKKQGKKRLAFKITGPGRIGYLTSIFPDAVFIRIHREPVATVRSLLKIPFWEERGKWQLWWQGPYSAAEKKWAEEHKDDPISLTAFQIKKVVEVTDTEIKETGTVVLDIKYQDFVKEPQKTIERILNYCELSQDQSVFDYFQENKIFDRNTRKDSFFNEAELRRIDEIFYADITHKV